MNEISEENPKIDSLQNFETTGYAGPFKIFSEAECQELMKSTAHPRSPITWVKSMHEKSRRVINAAKNSKIIELIKPILGDDILLWGSIFVGQGKAGAHDCHLDIEYRECEGVTMWVGLSNLEETEVYVISHSHLLDTSPSELAKEGIDVTDTAAVVAAAKNLDPRCELVSYTLKPGEMIFWSGRTWHGTVNKGDLYRVALILQYSTPEHKVKIPLTYDYPNNKWADYQPPCIMVAGSDHYAKNIILDTTKIGGLSDHLDTYKRIYKALGKKALLRRIKNDLKNNFHT